MSDADKGGDDPPNYEEVLYSEINYDILETILDEEPGRAYDDKVKRALASAKITSGNDMWSKFVGQVLPELDGVDYNTYQSTIKELGEEIEAERVAANTDGERGPPEVPEPEELTYWEDVEKIVLKHYDQRMLDVVEALCCNALVLTFEHIGNAPMMFTEGASGAGKTTGISFMEGTSNELLIRADEITPASFNSHSQDQEVEGENDLIPEIRHRVLSVRELTKLFSGDPEKIKEFWSTMATVGDGDGNMKATGSQGRRGYEGDYMFAFQGATTPLGPVAWNAMGTIGGRVLFHELIGEYTEETIRSARWDSDIEPSIRKTDCQDIVSEFLRTMWHERTNGYGSVEWQARDNWRPDLEVQNAITKFAHMTALARTPMNIDSQTGEWQARTPEVYYRLVDQFTMLARSRAQIHNRECIVMEDIGLIARVALSTMPKKRRPYVRWMMDPESAPESTGRLGLAEGKARLSEVVEYVGIDSRDTVLRHLKLLDKLDLLTLQDIGEGEETEWVISKNVSGQAEWSAGGSTRFDAVWTLGVPFPAKYFVERDD